MSIIYFHNVCSKQLTTLQGEINAEMHFWFGLFLLLVSMFR